MTSDANIAAILEIVRACDARTGDRNLQNSDTTAQTTRISRLCVLYHENTNFMSHPS